MKKIVILICLFSVCTASAQSYYSVLASFVQKSPQLKVLNATLTADSLSLRRGLNPMDPSVELEYFFDNEFELSIRQQFDFPTLYHQRNMIAKRGIDKAKLAYKAELRTLLLEVNDLYQQYVYYKNMIELLEKRAQGMTKLEQMSKTSLDNGAMTALEYKKSQIICKSAINDLNNAYNELSNIELSLKHIGIELNDDVRFEDFNFNGTKNEFLTIVMENEFGVQINKIDSLIAVHELKLARQEWIPKIEVGFKTEVANRNLRGGVIAGLSLPLWQNRNNVKHSKANLKVKSAVAQNYAGLLQVQLDDLFDDYITAKENCQTWAQTDLNNYAELMDKTLQAHSITSMEYLLELSSILESQLAVLNDKFNYALNGGRIAIYLSVN